MIARLLSLVPPHLITHSSGSEETKVSALTISPTTALFFGIGAGFAISGCCLGAIYALRGRMTHQNPSSGQQHPLDVEQGKLTHYNANADAKAAEEAIAQATDLQAQLNALNTELLQTQERLSSTEAAAIKAAEEAKAQAADLQAQLNTANQRPIFPDDLFQKFEQEDWFKDGKVPAEDGRVSFETDDLRILFKQFSVEYLSVFTEGKEVLLWDPSFKSELVELVYVCCYYELRNLGENRDSKLLDPKQSHLGDALSRLLFLTSAAERGKTLKMEKGEIKPSKSERFDSSLVTTLDTRLHSWVGMRNNILDFLETKFGKDKLKASPLKGYFNFDD